MHNDFYSAGNAFYEMGEMYFLHNNHNKALGGFINAKKYFIESKSDNEIALINFKIGRDRGNYKLSGMHLSYALRLAKQFRLKDMEADILEYMGLLYHVMPNLALHSNQTLRRALEIKQRLNDKKGALRILEKLAAVYYDQKKFDSALYFNSKAILLAEALKLSYDANLCRLSQVSFLLRLGNITKAKETLDLIKTHLSDTAYLNITIRYMIQTGNYNMTVLDTLSAQKKYNEALQVAQRTGFPEMFSLVYKNMSDAYYHHKDYKKAYQYQVLYTDRLTGLFSENSFTTLKELEYILKANSTEDEVRILNIQNGAKELQLKNERTVRLISMITAVGVLFSAIIIFTLYRKQKRKSLIIEKKDAELRTLMKEMHHRVKNNLQVISSFLDLQVSAIGEGLAAETIKESLNREQTMALIHQDLYQERNTPKTGMEDYVCKLVKNLFISIM
ncbi:histidine kinase dimerization/phosphoacceptor domain -containing protein [Parafilimonas sp.]|uniref:histidine kinase dimerization/phosphoacceptor domain -containing protein n=1 Tax=Parafilimonas sp. TaxID=1969739 RepID=UPI0039E3B0AF